MPCIIQIEPAEVAELDEAKTDNNLKQDLDKLGRGNYWIVVTTGHWDY